jgi:toxin ParE1/3/4
MNLRWTEEATTDLEQISHYIAEDNPEAALKTMRVIFSRIEELTTFPRRGRKGRVDGTLELVLSPLPYIAVYRVKSERDAVEILHVYHGAQDR